MESLFNNLESLALKVGTLATGLLIANKSGVRELIMRNAGSSDVEEVVRYGAYLTGIEYLTDMTASKVLGMRGISLHADTNVGFLVTFATNLAVYYVMEKTDVLDKVLETVGDGDVNRALGNAIVYTLTQEISYRIISYVMKPKASDYGEKFNFNNN